KLACNTIGRQRLVMLTSVSHYVAELANLPHRSDLPFVGRSAFAHKGGVHVSAVMKDPATYEHIDPELTGNSRRALASDLSGKSNVLYKAAEMGVDLSGSETGLKDVVDRIKALEHDGFQFEAAEGSFRLLLEGATGKLKSFFTLDSYTVETDRDSEAGGISKATGRLGLNGRGKKALGEGCGPGKALDRALGKALSDSFPCLKGGGCVG